MSDNRGRGCEESPAKALLTLEQPALALRADAEISSTYERLREETAEVDGERVHQNLRHLCATPVEREKDRREARTWADDLGPLEMQRWYEEARAKPCTWWLANHRVARRSLNGCLACGICTASCPAAQYYEEYNPRVIVDVALSGDEARLLELLQTELLWYCGQCGSCRPKCSRENNLMGLISSLRFLAQLKGYHVRSTRGRQQYAARHLWGGNLWNRGCSLYFRNVDPANHPDFGPRYAQYFKDVEQQMLRVGASPDRAGRWGGRKVPAETLMELRRCVAWGGTLVLWNQLEQSAQQASDREGLSIDEYHDKVRTEG
jgi:heterodisulfide reductase subunit C